MVENPRAKLIKMLLIIFYDSCLCLHVNDIRSETLERLFILNNCAIEPTAYYGCGPVCDYR